MHGAPAGVIRGVLSGAVAGLGLVAGAGLRPLAAQTTETTHPLAIARHEAPSAVAPAQPSNAPPAPGEMGRLDVGQVVRGELEPGDRVMADSTFADVWEFAGTGGETVTIYLRSDEFDTYLLLLDASGTTLGEDDDSGGDLNSRLTLTLPSTGTYQIVVNSAGHEQRAGMYTLSIEQAPRASQ